MMYWVLVVKDHRSREGRHIPAMDILHNRVRYGFWAISKRNVFRGKVKPGDLGVFYVASRDARVFAGDCVIKSESKPLDSFHRSLIEGFPSTMLDYYFEIEGRLWREPKQAREYAVKLSFVRNKARWGSYFQGSVKPISKQDYEVLLSGT